ncbi:hypothetical protein QI600_003188 [Salmonella enterica]|nr:hypothetical protein [Salmonella enterica]
MSSTVFGVMEAFVLVLLVIGVTGVISDLISNQQDQAAKQQQNVTHKKHTDDP